MHEPGLLATTTWVKWEAFTGPGEMLLNEGLMLAFLLWRFGRGRIRNSTHTAFAIVPLIAIR